MQSPRRHLRPPRVLQGPFGSALFGIAVVVLLVTLPPGHLDQSGSIVGGLVTRDSGHFWGIGHVAIVVRGSDAGTLLDIDTQSADELSRRVMDRPNDIVEFSVTAGYKQRGLLFLTSETVFAQFVALSADVTPFTQTESELVWSAISQWAATKPALTRHNPTAVADLLAGGTTRSRALWSGYALNALFLASIALWVNSLRWVPDWLRRVARKRRQAKGLCGACGYDLRGAPCERCPECGKQNRAGS